MADNENGKKSTYFAESQKRYNEKCKFYHIKYTLEEKEKAEIVNSAILKSGLTANAWIKTAIHDKLEKDGFIK
ncbi:MAG: hypothetical protein IJZ42_07195 [Lachnospiraceae bacterium]|nr:hypothetical protein [Lachnospiraceae bacterium]